MSGKYHHSTYKGALLPENLTNKDPQLRQNLEKLDSSFFYTISHINSFHSDVLTQASSHFLGETVRKGLVPVSVFHSFRAEDEGATGRKRIHEGFQQVSAKKKAPDTLTQMKDVFNNTSLIKSFQFDYSWKNARPQETATTNFSETLPRNIPKSNEGMKRENWSVFRKGREIEDSYCILSQEEKSMMQPILMELKKNGREREMKDRLDRFFIQKEKMLHNERMKKTQEEKGGEKEEVEETPDIKFNDEGIEKTDPEVDGEWILSKEDRSKILGAEDKRPSFDTLEREIQKSLMARSQSLAHDESTKEEAKLQLDIEPRESSQIFRNPTNDNDEDNDEKFSALLSKKKEKEAIEGKTLGQVYKNNYHDFLLEGKPRDPTRDARTFGFALNSFRHDLSERYYYRNNCFKLQEKLRIMNTGFNTIGRLGEPIHETREKQVKFTEKIKYPGCEEGAWKPREPVLIRIEENAEDIAYKNWQQEREKSLDILNTFLRK